MKLASKLQYIFLYLLSVIIIGAATILTGRVGLNILRDPSYYINQILTWAAILCVTFATLFAYLDKFKETNAEYIANEKYISDFASSKNNVPSIVSRFLEPLNRKRKIKQFRHNIYKKLYRLENRKKFIFFGPRVFKDEDLYIWNHGTIEQKSQNEYCLKRMRLEEQLLDDFIEANIDKMLLPYDKVTPNILFGGIYQSKDNDSPNDFITKSQASKIARYKIPKLLYSFAITFILSSLVFDELALNATNIINLCIKIMILLWNCYTTLRYAETFSISVTLKDSRFRKGIILEYEKWLQQEATKVLEQDKLEVAAKEKLLIAPIETKEEVIEDDRGNDTRTITEISISQS